MVAALTITEPGQSPISFSLAPTGKGGGRQIQIATNPWEPGDPKKPWRVNLHPVSAGLRTDRVKLHISPYSGLLLNRPPQTYAKGPVDSSNDGLILFPPLLTKITLTNAVTPSKFVEFNSLMFIVAGRYMYYIDPTTNTATQDKDFGAGKAAVDAEVFNGELIVAMGASEKIWKRTTAGTWTQATDATYAIALGLVNSSLWRASEGLNKVSSCTASPLTLASWLPASGSDYTVGDSTYPVRVIRDYGGVPWMGKDDGMYSPDPNSVFHNQTPQLAENPNPSNTVGAFTAQGFLWIPSAAGLIRIKPGQAYIRGPEITERPDYRFWVRGGVEFGNWIYLLVDDEGAASNTAIIKMERDTLAISDNDYIYHEYAQLPGTTKGFAIGVSSKGTNPEVFAAYGNDVYYLKLGRGGGRDIDDANYTFGTSMTLESGMMMTGPDLSVVEVVQGVTTLLNYSTAGASLNVDVRVDGAGNSWVPMLSTQEGGGTQPIQNTAQYQSVTRYAPPNTVGKLVELRLTGSATSSATGTTRPEIREVWIFGYSRPQVTDTITLGIAADGKSRLQSGIRNGLSAQQTQRLFRTWQQNAVVLLASIDGYDTGDPCRFLVTSVGDVEVQASIGPNNTTNTQKLIQVELMRIQFAGPFVR